MVLDTISAYLLGFNSMGELGREGNMGDRDVVEDDAEALSTGGKVVTNKTGYLITKVS